MTFSATKGAAFTHHGVMQPPTTRPTANTNDRVGNPVDHLSLDITTTPEGITVAASGEIDMATVDQLKATLTGLCVEGVTVRLDTRDVTFMDSTGINALVILDRHSKQAGGGLVLYVPITRRAPAPRLHRRRRRPERRRLNQLPNSAFGRDTTPGCRCQGAVMRAVSLVWKRSPTPHFPRAW